MRNWRRFYKIFCLVCWSLLIAPVAALSLIGLSKWAKIRRGSFWAMYWAKGAAWTAGVKTVVHGEVKPDNGALLVSNHLGYLDILAHASNFRLRFTPNDGIRRWFFVGFLVSLSCPIWIDRKNRRKAAGYAEIFRETMENGVSLLVYPEGTTTDGKHGFLPFKSTVFANMPEDRPILPMVLFYRETGGDGTSAAWFDDTAFYVHVWNVLGLKEIRIDLYILPEMFAYPGEERKELACRVREAMLKEYEKHAG